MLYHLLVPLVKYFTFFNVFSYITFRAGGAAVTALIVSFLIGPIFIRKAKSWGLCSAAREGTPDTHKEKSGTPIAGGLIIVTAVLSGTMLFARLDHLHVWMLVIATIWMGRMGWRDDWLKARGYGGVAERYKIIGQLVLGVGIGVVLYFFPEHFSAQFAEYKTATTVPFVKGILLNFALFAPYGCGLLFIGMIIFMMITTTNALNLTDGLDGLAIGQTAIIAVGLAILSYVTGHIRFSDYLHITYLPGSGEITVYCAAVVGASLGFLWFNSYPAMIWMGDTGSLALGGGLVTAAILIKKELFLIILGGVIFWELTSSFIQIYYFKLTRRYFCGPRRFFRKAPVHHHYELQMGDVYEREVYSKINPQLLSLLKREENIGVLRMITSKIQSRIVIRFWIIGILLLFLTLMSFKVR